MRIEQAKKKLADLDQALLNLKHSITTNVKDLSSSVPNTDALTAIGLNVLRRAQTVRDSLVQTMWQAKTKRKPQTAKAKTARAAVKAKKSTAKKRKPVKKTNTSKKKSTRRK